MKHSEEVKKIPGRNEKVFGKNEKNILIERNKKLGGNEKKNE